MNVKVELTINGRKCVADVEPRMHLGDFLREHLRLTATHLGCEHGVCGACTVLIDGEPARACIALTAALEGADIQTLEGLADDQRMAVLKTSFHERHGLQCGFCTPGMLISAWDLLRRKPDVSEREIRQEMSGNLCRCTGYQGIVRSIKHAADALQSAVDA
jgi:carbon-monoxide dehydrogenase small subunit